MSLVSVLLRGRFGDLTVEEANLTNCSLDSLSGGNVDENIRT